MYPIATLPKISKNFHISIDMYIHVSHVWYHSIPCTAQPKTKYSRTVKSYKKSGQITVLSLFLSGFYLSWGGWQQKWMIFCYCHRVHIRVLWRFLMCFFNGVLIVVLMWCYCFFMIVGWCLIAFYGCLIVLIIVFDGFLMVFDGLESLMVFYGFWWLFNGFLMVFVAHLWVFLPFFSSLWRPSRPGPGRTAPSSGTFGDFSWDFKGKNLGMSWIFREIQQNSGDCCIPSGKLT